MTLDDVRNFIAAHGWKFAKSMPKSPHEYTLRKNARDEDEFVRVVAFIREHGQARKWFRATYVYLEVDGWEYWTMGAPLPDTILINRARPKPKGAYVGTSKKA